MPQPKTGAAARSSRSLPLILAWSLVLFALLAGLAYAFLIATEERPPGSSEVQIALSKVPTLAEEATEQKAAPAVSSLPVIADSSTPGGDEQRQEAGTLPEIAPAPVQPSDQVAAETAVDNEIPKIAVVVSGLGLSEAATAAAIKGLPAAITLSFTPYGADIDRWLGEARGAGHEVMMDLPMEPASFPSNDPGPRALITSLSEEENLARLEWILGRGRDFVGVTGVMGSRFSRSRDQMLSVFGVLKERGLLYLDNRATELSIATGLAAEIGLPRALNNRTIDENHASPLVIDARLAQIERLALTEGFAVAIAHPFPLTLERLATWSETLAERGFALVPITAVVDRQAF